MKATLLRAKPIISLLLLAGLLASCGGESPAETDISTADTTAAAPSGDAPEDFRKSLVPEKLGGEFNITVTTQGNFVIDAENGDPISDAKYRRNLAVENLYDIEIKETVANKNAVQAAVLAGDDAYDACMLSLYRDAANSAAGDLLYNVSGVDSLNTDAEWWDRNLMDTTKLSGKSFYLAGDIDYTLYGRTIALFFNKPMMEQLSGENIYKLVSDGKWTFDKLDGLQRNATRDLNGDTVMDDRDSYGIINSAIHAQVLFSAAGGRIAMNEGGKYQLSMNTPRNMEAITRIFEITLGAADYCYNTDTAPQDGIWDRVLEMFRNEQALFQSTVLYNAINQRSMESDFGIIPYPKFDEAQEHYYSTSINGNAVFVIPKTVKDPERMGKIMNALAVNGRYTVKPAFYDEALGVKFVRDDESKEMLDIIFDNVIFDVGFMYNLNGLGELLRNMHKAGSTSFASEYASKESGAKEALDKLLSDISAMG